MKRINPFDQNLAGRLAGYSAAAGTLALLGSAADAQIVYSGIQDISLAMPLSVEEIDLNGDLVNDFAFYFKGYAFSSTYGPYIFSSHFGLGAIMNPRTDGFNNSWIIRSGQLTLHYSNYLTSISTQIDVPLVREMGTDEEINDMETYWSNTNSLSVAGVLGYQRYVSYYNTPSSWGYVNFMGGGFIGEMKFIGVRFFIGTDIHYGWIRLRMNESAQDMRIMDWAWEANPGIGIRAGEGGDLTGPVVSLEGAEESTPHQKTTLVVIMDEFTRGLEISDFVVTNGTASNLFMLNPGMVYTVDILADDFGEVTVELPAGAISDPLGYGNEGVSVNWEYFDSSLELQTKDRQEFRFYPNPANKDIYIEAGIVSDLQLLDLNGRLLLERSGVLKHTIDVSSLKQGIYFLRVKNDQGIEEYKLAIE